jgi:TPR repeat protein/tRNA A-37 threonylcarbamoyl transferase component Bud32
MQAPPERLGKYLIRRELGRGAMGVVYEGYDPLIERAVAIKVLRIDEANAQLDAELRMRFRREAQAAGRLSHPNIVSVYEYGEEAGSSSAFIAMELVEGRDLKSLFDAGTRFALADAGRIMSELLSAMQHAHVRGVVHRDIKPANIILLADGSVKVADFGIAKLDTSELTQLGSVLGTVSHMSPEQLTGDAVDRRSDLFSCGVILYQLLTGERAFSGSPATVMHKVLHEQPAPPSSVVAALPRPLDAVVRKAMAKTPAERYPDADAFAAALRAAIAGAAASAAPASADADADATVLLPRAPAAAPARSAPSRAPVVAGVGALSLLAVGAAAYVFLRTPSTPAPAASGGAATLAMVPGSGAASSAASASSALAASAAPAAPAPTVAPVVPPVPATAVAAGPSAEEIEQQAWDDALKSNTRGAFEAYLKGYPQGRFSARARVRLAALAPPPQPQPQPQPQAPPPQQPQPPAPTQAKTPPQQQSQPQVQAQAPELAKAPVPTTSSSASPKVAAAPLTAPPPAKATSTGAVAAAGPRPESPPSAPDRAKRPPASPEPAPATARAAAAIDCIDEAKRGNARCQVVLGNAYRSGTGVARDPVEASRWYRKAAEQGNDVGQYELGTLYESGLGVPKDATQAVSWFRKAADQGLARAQNRVGVAYENGTTGSANLVLAADWYRKAVDQGHAGAQSNLGRLYLQGRGVFKDTAKAGELLQKAVDQGDPNAMVLLAGMYQRGEGKPQDSARAARLYRDALAIPGLSQRHREIAQAALAAKS